MSITRKLHKQSRESYASRAMHNTMGVLPELGQMYDRTLSNELISRRTHENELDVPADFEQIEILAATTGEDAAETEN
ncbi:hypothetical protein [Tellurirhabdus rosea]|uniref:hypothetical protein n=1 Tax=Tellurirhabdus rosea TaxID=2674997 RepID=UPI0022541EAD|nr:hypothetical protein [Tellurirhabdus rosea]